MTARLIIGDAHKALRTLGMNSAHACVTSPPYWGKRDYTGLDVEHGKGSLDEWVNDVATTFDLVRDVLTPDALLWVVLDDTAVGSGGAGGDYGTKVAPTAGSKSKAAKYHQGDAGKIPHGSLAGAPFALEAEMFRRGWILRSRVVWVKGRPDQISVSREAARHIRRPKHSYEIVQLWAPTMTYHYRHEVATERLGDVWFGPDAANDDRGAGYKAKAPYPLWLVEKCLRLSCMLVPGETVLDPYAGACTTLKAAQQLGLDSVGVDIDPDSVKAAQLRLIECEVTTL